MSRRQPFDPDFPKRLAAQFFSTTRQAREPFWTVREIAERFDVSRHAATLALRALARQGVLTLRSRQGAFVPDKLPAITEYKRLMKPHLAVVFPEWAGDNIFGMELRGELVKQAHANRWSFTFFQEPGYWNDPKFATSLLAMGCTSLIALNAGDRAAIPIAKLRDSSMPVMTIGRNTSAFDALNIPAVDGDDGEAMHRLVCQLLSRGLRRIVTVGAAPSIPQKCQSRLDAFRQALAQFKRKPPADVLIETGDINYIVSTLQRRLKARQPPQALIFHDYSVFLNVLKNLPDFLTRARKSGILLAVFDHFFLNRRYPDLSIVEISLDPVELAHQAIALLRLQAQGKTVKPLTLVQYRIQWPE